MFQLKEKDNISEKELNKMVTSNLPDRVQSTGHKNDHQTQEKNGQTQ